MNELRELKELITTKPLYLFATLTFKKNLPVEVELSAINKYLDNLNRKVFTGTYQQLNLFLQGYAVQEKKFGDSPNHYHLLINDDSRIRPERKAAIKQLHEKSVAKVNELGREHDIQKIYSLDVVGYFLKNVKSVDDVLMISANGVA